MDTDTHKSLAKLAKGLAPDALRQLEYLFCLVELKHGENVCEAGQHSSSLYVLHSGVVRISVTRGDSTVHVPTMQRGDWVGEVCLFSPGEATATVSVLGQASLLEFTHDALLEFMAKSPRGATQLIDTLMRDMAKRLHNTSDSLVRFDKYTALLTSPPKPEGAEVQGLFQRLLGLNKG